MSRALVLLSKQKKGSIYREILFGSEASALCKVGNIIDVSSDYHRYFGMAQIITITDLGYPLIVKVIETHKLVFVRHRHTLKGVLVLSWSEVKGIYHDS